MGRSAGFCYTNTTINTNIYFSLKAWHTIGSQVAVTGNQGVLETIKFFFGLNRNKPKLNLFRLFFGLFRETKNHFFQLVLVCFVVSDRYRNNRNKPKKSPKNFGVLETVNFFSPFEPKQTETQSVSVIFRFAFSGNNKFFFGLFRFVLMFRTSIKTTETNRTYGMGN